MRVARPGSVGEQVAQVEVLDARVVGGEGLPLARLVDRGLVATRSSREAYAADQRIVTQPSGDSASSSPSAMSNQAPWRSSVPCCSRSRIQGKVRRFAIDCSTERSSSRALAAGDVLRGRRAETGGDVAQAADPGADEVGRAQRVERGRARPRSPPQPPVAQDDDVPDTRVPSTAYSSAALAAWLAPVWLVRRDQPADVPDDEQLARTGVEHRLRRSARVRAGDDRDAGTLALGARGAGSARAPPHSGRHETGGTRHRDRAAGSARRCPWPPA